MTPYERGRERAEGPMAASSESGAGPAWRAHVPLVAAATLLLAALVLGGTLSGGTADSAVHAVAVIGLGVALLWWRPAALTVLQRGVLVVVVSAVALATLQLVPLGVEWFARLPQRAELVAELRAAGVAPRRMPMTLDYWGTVQALLALMVFLVMWMLCTTMSSSARTGLLKLAVVAAVPMALFGFAQASMKLDTTGANGLFENRNHYATLLAMSLPFALAAARQAMERTAVAFAVAWYAAVCVMLLAAALSFSRVGTVLAFLSAVAGLALLTGGASRRGSLRRPALVSLAIAIAGVGYFASDRLVERFQSDFQGDLRWQIFENSWQMLTAYLPWGSGFGTFREVYAQFEPLPSLGEFTHANHAHNELLQNTIEGGLPALVLMGAFLGLVVAAAAAALFRRGAADYWQRAAAISVAVPLIHSLVDYPLRTLACSTLLALAVATLLSPERHEAPGRVPSWR